MLQASEPWIEKGIHPRHIIGGYTKALDDAMNALEKFHIKVDINNREQVIEETYEIF